MNEALKWVLEYSRAQGATQLVLIHLAKHAERCIAMVGIDQLAREAKISRRKVFYALQRAEKLGEIQRLQALGRGQVGIYHFQKRGAQKNASGSDRAQNACPYLVEFSARYGKGAFRAYIRGTPQNLLAVPAHFELAYTEEDMRFFSNELRRKVGLPLAPAEEFHLKP